MSYRHTLDAAIESLHEIEDLLQGFPEYGKIPALEIDLTLQKIRNLYELMLMMRGRMEETPPIPVTPAPEKVEQNIPSAPEVKSATATTISFEEKTTITETRLDPPTNAPVGKKKAGDKEIQTLSDQFRGRKTLHESLHQTYQIEGETLAHTKPVADLLTAIGINDRFTFIRELFNNDSKAFEGTISILNDAASFNDAYNFMIQQFNWDMDSEAVQLLLDIIRRKHITGRHE